MQPVKAAAPKAPANSIEKLQQQRFDLQEKATNAVLKEIQLQKSQQDEELKLGEIQVGLLRQQVEQVTQQAAQYQQQIGLLSQTAQTQQVEAAAEEQRTSLMATNAASTAANRSSYRRNLTTQRKAKPITLLGTQ